MKDFKRELLGARRISVWGIGYLGYTSLLMLQSKGFFADIYDFDTIRLEHFMAGKYPAKEHKESWSSKSDIQQIDLSRVFPSMDMNSMFENSVHIISFPGHDESMAENRLKELSHGFISHKEKLANSLILFQSAETPGDIERYFIKPLEAEGVECSFCAIFRTDWSVEEFFKAERKQMVAGHDKRSMAKVELLLCMLGIDYISLAGIKAAEIYENARKVLNYLIASFVNQLCLAYSDVDIRPMIPPLIQSVQQDDIASGMGPIGYKSTVAVESLLSGSLHPERLRLVCDVEPANLSAILNYAEIIKRMSITDVTILGVCEKGDQKDVRLSGTLVLAEKLIEENITVRLHDPYFTQEGIVAIVPGAQYAHLDGGMPETQCLVLMTDHRVYRYLTQPDLNRIIGSARLVVDNPGLWEKFSFPRETIYHVPGDGKLEWLGR